MTRCFVIIKDQYGNEVVHPDCVNSRLLAKIAGTKTLTRNTIKYAKQLGYVFEETANQLQGINYVPHDC